MVERKEYLERLIQWKDEQVIKVVTGIRRCGKSTLLLQYQEWLKASGVSDEQIVTINFEELEYEELQDYKKLYAYLKDRLCKGKMTCRRTGLRNLSMIIVSTTPFNSITVSKL